MIYQLEEPSSKLKTIIKSFWHIDSQGDPSSSIQKIIPDGFPELIFHYQSPYKANISGSWFLQDKYLVAGQIRNHFYIENTGSVGMFGIKLQPWTLKLLFNLDMSTITDKVIAISKFSSLKLETINSVAIDNISFNAKVQAIENWFISQLNSKAIKPSNGQKAAQYIIDSKGEISIQKIIEDVGVSERSLERYFKSHIGVSPKFYSRIIRFSNIFNLVQVADFNWSDVTYLAGFYDQSHFIKNFKEFTGEEPSTYGFTEENMANFFLKR